MKVIGAGLPRTGHAVAESGAGDSGNWALLPHGQHSWRHEPRAGLVRRDAREGQLERGLRRLRRHRRLAGVVLLPGAHGGIPRSQGVPVQARRRGVGAQHDRHDLGLLLGRLADERYGSGTGAYRPGLECLHRDDDRDVGAIGIDGNSTPEISPASSRTIRTRSSPPCNPTACSSGRWPTAGSRCVSSSGSMYPTRRFLVSTTVLSSPTESSMARC